MPDILAAIKKIKGEMPDQASTPIEPQGFFGRMLGNPQARATASPWTGNVTYNPEVMSKLSPDQAENVLTHELTHSRQIQQTPYLQRFTNVARSMIPGAEESYYQRPREMEAYQAEKDRTARLHLPNMEDPMTGATDIDLPVSPRRKVMQQMYINGQSGGGR